MEDQTREEGRGKRKGTGAGKEGEERKGERRGKGEEMRRGGRMKREKWGREKIRKEGEERREREEREERRDKKRGKKGRRRDKRRTKLPQWNLADRPNCRCSGAAEQPRTRSDATRTFTQHGDI